ncbi:hypothetical protein BXT86_04100 [candidate division WOR-3 bacterium 4484_100]|uniref:HTH luxR-type domain-containing protein n=1 Tax=candidate division WOR-3 bacterium 4484_100 TaxID=1936077 RepID=A0A1V4QG96_UNCW3|nr:MAG: hypothetical protein BXT86_04100 [candidate division WOR-3 bacterium 4484_100]
MKSDETLMKQFQRGDDDAFSELVERYQQKLFNYFIRHLNDYDRAEDLTQDLFIRVYRYGHSFDCEQRFRPWVYKIARNILRKELKSEQDGKRLKAKILYGYQPFLNPDYEIIYAVREAINKLPQAQKEVIILKEYQGMTFAEIAEVLGCPESTVKTRLYKALKRLRKKLKRFRR